MRHSRRLEALALASHGALGVLHGLGVVYHVTHPRRQWRFVAFHGIALVVDGVSFLEHLLDL